MKEIFTAKSIEEAKHLAVEKFGVSEDQIVFRILEEPKKGIFGKVKREAQVEAVYEAAEEAAPAETTEAKAPEQPEAPQPQVPRIWSIRSVCWQSCVPTAISL